MFSQINMHAKCTYFENESATSRGRMLTHGVLYFYKMHLSELVRKRRCQLRQRLMAKSNALLNIGNRNSNPNAIELFLSEAIMFHYYSCDKATRPQVLPIAAPVLDPVLEHSTNDFYHLTDFRPDQFVEVINEMTLIPDRIIHRKTHATASKEIACFILLHRWRKADTWDDVRKPTRRGRCNCINMHYALFYEIKQNYKCCVLVLDFCRLTPALLEAWSETLEARTGAEKDLLFFCDGKAWRTCRRGRGKVARNMLDNIGENNINLMQRPIAMTIVDCAG